MSLYVSKYCYCKSVKAKDHILFLIVITQSRTFSLKLGTSIKNFLTTKYYLESYFQKE